MTSQILRILVILTVTSLIAACGGGGGSSSDNDSNDPPVVTGLASIVGVYEWFDEYPGGLVDEWYFAIDAQGYVSDYDYMGDSYDNLGNCYVIDRDWEQLVYVSENRFSTVVAGEDLFIEIQDGGLLITPVDGSSEPEYIGPKVDIDVSSFETAECDSNNLTSFSTNGSEENSSVSKLLNKVKKTP